MKALMTLTAAALGFMMTTGARAEEPTWTGCHIGGSIGMSAVDADVRFGPFHDSMGGSGVNWGAGVGCDMQIPDNNNFLIGVFADYTWLDLDNNTTFTKMTYDGQWTVGGRIGTLLTPSTLGYLLVGYSEMDASKLRVLGSNVAVSDFSGYAVGGGLETSIGNNLRLGLEYRYYDYDGDSAHKWGETISLDPDIQTVQLRLKWQLWTPTGLVPVPLK